MIAVLLVEFSNIPRYARWPPRYSVGQYLEPVIDTDTDANLSLAWLTSKRIADQSKVTATLILHGANIAVQHCVAFESRYCPPVSSKVGCPFALSKS